MNKQERYDLYRISCGPGWWPILDKYVPKILEADPDIYMYIKEKYGLLRIETSSKKIPWEQTIALEEAAEIESSTVCECCGQPGKIRDLPWILTLCDDCLKKDMKGREAVEEETEKRWLETAE